MLRLYPKSGASNNCSMLTFSSLKLLIPCTLAMWSANLFVSMPQMWQINAFRSIPARCTNAIDARLSKRCTTTMIENGRPDFSVDTWSTQAFAPESVNSRLMLPWLIPLSPLERISTRAGVRWTVDDSMPEESYRHRPRSRSCHILCIPTDDSWRGLHFPLTASAYVTLSRAPQLVDGNSLDPAAWLLLQFWPILGWYVS